MDPCGDPQRLTLLGTTHHWLGFRSVAVVGAGAGFLSNRSVYATTFSVISGWGGRSVTVEVAQN